MKGFLICLSAILFSVQSHSQIKRVWLTHQTTDPSAIVVSWYSQKPGDSEVFFRTNKGKETRLSKKGNGVLHHVAIPLNEKDTEYHYRVRTGAEESGIFTFKAYPSADHALRVAVVGNWGYAESPDLSKLKLDNPHLLVTLGDNVANLHELCGEGNSDCVEPFLRLIDSEPELFQTTPFMPILGNHDKEIRPRGIKYPPVAVYDTNATAYRTFFELPGKEWVWKFEIPEHAVSFLALDLNHLTDMGTTWQTSHSYSTQAEQFKWFRSAMAGPGVTKITLLNERNELMRRLENESWRKILEQGTAVISGYGYYAERADVEGFPYFTTSLKAGDVYPDKHARFVQRTPGYMLLTFASNKPPRFEMKTLSGDVMEVFSPTD